MTKKVIGVTGTHRGAGVTLFSVNMAVFLSQVCGLKIAVVEVNKHNDFLKIQMELSKDEKVKVTDEYFLFHSICFYKNVSQKSLPSLFNENYDSFILDLGSMETLLKDEFLRCNQKIVMCNLVEWKRDNLEHFMEAFKEIQEKKGWNFMVNLSGKEIVHELILEKGVLLQPVPVITDPFIISKEMSRLYYLLL
ncbi:hypothetical protein [Anaeromicropila populeti]|uniref:CobQ/CobB/MinD/ParA nucleotide binding domain-containing protein n=1 Tax=Anaeromicropila populeti TaxID=37658 RepID=A0A1I6I7T2_9FIRM|nr:hypothetical protein [Anaeromicropila populeti]SFR62714.1 hypothetical protein SAMN05661086_00516 [Anaeromicropila populeti]